VLDRVSPTLQTAMLDEFQTSMERTPQVVDGVIATWKKGDADAFFVLNQKSFNNSKRNVSLKTNFFISAMSR
jgi:hypothetical protein